MSDAGWYSLPFLRRKTYGDIAPAEGRPTPFPVLLANAMFDVGKRLRAQRERLASHGPEYDIAYPDSPAEHRLLELREQGSKWFERIDAVMAEADPGYRPALARVDELARRDRDAHDQFVLAGAGLAPVPEERLVQQGGSTRFGPLVDWTLFVWLADERFLAALRDAGLDAGVGIADATILNRGRPVTTHGLLTVAGRAGVRSDASSDPVPDAAVRPAVARLYGDDGTPEQLLFDERAIAALKTVMPRLEPMRWEDPVTVAPLPHP
ncbi:hypothetical protein [Patulibacter sp. SYSU D01012]|uniref:hypothetical protein n=1 Tax=Patulibacter sp. SYSU D01012 TaxID=2817381 RepID=UPI001B31439B|nr:hypothetical protein [Patulibacter sp. SYSU D01012]